MLKFSQLKISLFKPVRKQTSRTVSKKMLFTVLWLFGMVGVLSLLWLEVPGSEELPAPAIAIKLLTHLFAFRCGFGGGQFGP
jgi:apolipoprotein N-acyltransferase